MKLKPCPFCGGDDLTPGSGVGYYLKYIRCKNCDAEGPFSDTPEQAWNKRRKPKALKKKPMRRKADAKTR